MQDSSKDIAMLIAGLVVFGVAWVATGGPGSSENSLQSKRVVPTSRTLIYKEQKVKTTNETATPENTSTIFEKEFEDAQEELGEIERRLKELERFSDASPYKDLVSLGRGNARSDDANKEYVELRAAGNLLLNIVIDNWRLESAVTGSSITFGKASYLPVSGQVNTEEPIRLRGGERVYVTTGRSPIGISFQTNKCTGYFTQFQSFTPSLKRSCPDPENEILAYKDRSILIDNTCLDFVERISSCSVSTKFPLGLSPSCQQAIVEEVNYNSCIRKHRNDVDFWGGEWRIFLKREEELWRQKREIIKLLDGNGKLIDFVSY